MKTIKMIDLLNKLANGEEVPKKIKYKGYKFVKIECNDFLRSYIRIKSKEFLESCTDKDDDLLFRNYRFELNDKVEILEEEKKIPEKLNTWYGIEPVNLDSPTTFKDNSKYIDFNTEMFFDKINEILDYLESKGK